ncbi:unnamed protein product, partial [marine sediment metagenome]
LGRSSAWFPLVGTLVGGLLSLPALLVPLPWSSLVGYALILVVWVMVTRGFHLDGLADTADGLGGATTTEKRLAIMKDSRVGVFGVLAVFCLLLLKFVFLADLGALKRGGYLYIRALLAIPTLGRWGMLLGMFFFPAASTEGMGQLFKKNCRCRELLIGTVTALLVVLLTIGLWGFLIAGAVGLISVLLSLYFSCSLDGLTGDTYGALCETGELFGLLALTLLSRVITSLLCDPL